MTAIEFTNRELQVIHWVVTDAPSNRELAETMGITVDSVKGYLWRIYIKTGMGNKLELFAFVMAHPEIQQRAAQSAAAERKP
jgi:DNA-binding CsgD family transcriptional regulator